MRLGDNRITATSAADAQYRVVDTGVIDRVIRKLPRQCTPARVPTMKGQQNSTAPFAAGIAIGTSREAHFENKQAEADGKSLGRVLHVLWPSTRIDGRPSRERGLRTVLRHQPPPLTYLPPSPPVGNSLKRPHPSPSQLPPPTSLFPPQL